MEYFLFSFNSCIDYGCKISTVIIAVVNLLLLINRYKKTDEDAKDLAERNRKLSLLKTLILDHNLHYYYDIFEEIEKNLADLKKKDCDKSRIEKDLQYNFRQIFEKFLNFLSIIDTGLFESVKKECDECRDELVTNIVDEGINLYVEAQFNSKIKNRVQQTKETILSSIFNYKG